VGARARAIEEAAAYSARRSAEILTELLGVRLGEAILTGGAARSTLWPQILADVLGLAVRVPAITESAAAGAAAVAGLAVGVRPSAAADAGPALPPARAAGPKAADAASPSSLTAWVAEPTPARRQRYDELYDQWRMAYDRPGLARDGRNGR
jgi:sugar (pentulose or hexulose) kinase